MENSKSTITEIFGEVIYSYTRKQAIEDGVLIDVSAIAAEAGFKIPVSITAGVSGLINNIPEKYSCQSYEGRLWDVVYMAAYAARNNKDKSIILYPLIMHHEVQTIENGVTKKRINKMANLKMHCGPGDKGEPVITIMLLDED